MSFDPNLNHNDPNILNSEDNCLDFPDWCHNEESFDLTTFMSSSRNLELCNDDLFENLFPSNSPPPPTLKKNEDNEELDDPELECWYHPAMNDPMSACVSACSSTATSPVPQNYYNTPPVTPRAERYRTASPHPLQSDNLTTPISTSLWPDKSGAVNSHDTQSHIVEVKKEYVDNWSYGFAKPESSSSVNEQSMSGAIYHVHEESAPVDSAEPHSSKRSQPESFQNSSKKTKLLEKGSTEYYEKRKRNNVAVRRSRDKAKKKAEETQKKVNELSNENAALRKRVAELSHELTTLKNLLTSLPQTSNTASKI